MSNNNRQKRKDYGVCFSKSSSKPTLENVLEEKDLTDEASTTGKVVDVAVFVAIVVAVAVQPFQ